MSLPSSLPTSSPLLVNRKFLCLNFFPVEIPFVLAQKLLHKPFPQRRPAHRVQYMLYAVKLTDPRRKVQCLQGPAPRLAGLCLFPHAPCANKRTRAARRVAVRSRRRSFRKIPNVTEVPAYCNYIHSSKRLGISFGFSTGKEVTATDAISCFISS